MVTACLLCAEHFALGSVQGDPEAAAGHSAARRATTAKHAPSYDALNLNLFLSLTVGTPRSARVRALAREPRSCLTPYSGQPSSRNYVTRVRRGGSHRAALPEVKTCVSSVRMHGVNLVGGARERFARELRVVGLTRQQRVTNSQEKDTHTHTHVSLFVFIYYMKRIFKYSFTCLNIMGSHFVVNLN